ncbi:GAD-like domain-containing protein [Pseudoduganella chitinolytica]|uniref:GAD-like domain-containing protein n=1 Tax=Pseudoduganella chitinolytica TaxID=34070 RepID=A0ABY8BA75_9BURK|nr:GAD-like domain-containing protein [Pseudoduganella chitinolytica]WEF32822.1 GAD-like domain-containing protein [Pseudoduganella chitinolytica]
MDENFSYFLEQMGPAIDVNNVPPSTIERYRGKLPNQLLTYWEEHGWSGYADGLFWTVNPQEYEPVLEAWIGDSPFMEQDAYHIIGRTAFGGLYFWGENTGNSLQVLPWDALAFPSAGAAPYIAAGRGEEAMSWFFSTLERADFELEDDNQRPLFTPALRKLGRLKRGEMYGFVPALALGGTATIDHLQKVQAVEHLVILAQLAPLRVMQSPFG